MGLKIIHSKVPSSVLIFPELMELKINVTNPNITYQDGIKGIEDFN